MIFLFCQILHADLLFTGLDDVLRQLEQVEQRPSRGPPRLDDTSDKSDKWWRERYCWAPATVTFQEDVQNEESLRNECRWATLCDWAHRGCDKTQSFLLKKLSQGRVCADSWSPRDFAAFSGQQTLSARPTFEVGDARLGSAGLWGEHHESSRRKAPAREDSEGSFGRERQGVPFSEDVIVEETGTVDPNLGVIAKGSCLIEVLRLGGSYELVYRIWAQFTLSALRVNVDVTRSRDEVLVSSYSLLRIFYVACAHPICWIL